MSVLYSSFLPHHSADPAESSMIALGLRNLLLKTLGTVGPSGHAHQTVCENLILPKYMFKHSQTIIKYVAKQMLMNLVVQPYLHPFVHVKNPPLVYVFLSPIGHDLFEVGINSVRGYKSWCQVETRTPCMDCSHE